jgi:hypothetical protein
MDVQELHTRITERCGVDLEDHPAVRMVRARRLPQHFLLRPRRTLGSDPGGHIGDDSVPVGAGRQHVDRGFHGDALADCLGVKLGVGPSAFYVGDYTYLLDSMKRLLQSLEKSTG